MFEGNLTTVLWAPLFKPHYSGHFLICLYVSFYRIKLNFQPCVTIFFLNGLFCFSPPPSPVMFSNHFPLFVLAEVLSDQEVPEAYAHLFIGQ